MITPEIIRLRETLRELQERKKILDQIKLENNVDIENDKCYIVTEAQISLTKKLIKEFEDANKRVGIFGGRSS